MTSLDRSCCSSVPGVPDGSFWRTAASVGRASSGIGKWSATPSIWSQISPILPINGVSVDAVLLPHTLEYAPDPYAVLREADRVLAAEGQLIVLGFRPASLWGLRSAASRAGFPPGLRRQLAAARIHDWLGLLSYEIVSARPYLYRLPRSPGGNVRGGDPEHAAPRLVLSLASGGLSDQGAQARLHPDADPAASARAAHGSRGPRGTERVSAAPVEIYTDGACRGNPGPGGWGALLSFGSHEKELSGAESPTTNNRMELQAVIGALQALKRPVAVRLYTDSQYVRRGILEWLPQWKARGWKTADRKPVKNQDLWQQLERRRRAIASSGTGCRGTPACRATSGSMHSLMPRSMRCLR